MANNFDLNVNPLSGSQLEVIATDAVSVAGADKVLISQSGIVRETTAQGIADLGGGGTTIYSGDGSLAGNRIVDLDGNSLSIPNSGQTYFSLDPTAGSESALIQSNNITGDGSTSIVAAFTTNTSASLSFIANFNDGVKDAEIEVTCDASNSTITHTADIHTFNINGVMSAVYDGQLLLNINPEVGDEVSYLQARNATDGANISRFKAATTNTQATVDIFSAFNDSVKRSDIQLLANTSTSTITHTADSHTFNGNVVNSNRLLEMQGADVASAAGAIALGSDGNIFEITGTNAITLISNLNWQNGSIVHLMFTSTASLTHGTATSGTDITMLLAGAANFTGSANDVITLVLGEIGGTQAWREVSRSVN